MSLDKGSEIKLIIEDETLIETNPGQGIPIAIDGPEENHLDNPPRSERNVTQRLLDSNRPSNNPLQRNRSGSVAAASGAEVSDLYQQYGELNYRVKQLENSVVRTENLNATNQRLNELAEATEHGFLESTEESEKTNERLQTLAEQVNLADFDIKARITDLEERLVKAYNHYTKATISHANANGDVAQQEALDDIHEHQQVMNDAAMIILALRAQQNLGKSTSPLVESTIDNLQKQLREVIRKNQFDLSAIATNRWSLRNLWATDKDAQALRSVQKLAKNPAFSGLDKRTDAELQMNQKLLELMTYAIFALSHFSKTVAPAQPGYFSIASPAIRLQTDATNTPMRTSSSSALATPPDQQQQTNDANIVNHVVIELIRAELAEIQTEAGGLIGSPNQSLQNWGKALMIIALSILAIVSAAALMSILGFATPAFIVPYLAAVQSMSMITTVLNFVAAKLTVDLNTAAAVTAVAVAGTFGMFGKITHFAGSPTSLKRDLDRAAQDLEAALADTPAATMAL